MSTTVTPRVGSAPSSSTTKRVLSSGAVSGTTYDSWGGSWAATWLTAWTVTPVATAASPAVDVTPRVSL